VPEFASVAAYIVIDTFVLLIWHQTLFARVCRDTPRQPHLQNLINVYLQQCNPLPLMACVDPTLFLHPVITAPHNLSLDNPA
jgi:hypothetical protein